jgi:hypothetical protein
MQGLTLHDIKMIVLIMLWQCFLTFTLFTNIGEKQADILGSDGAWQLNYADEAFISYILQESMDIYKVQNGCSNYRFPL